MDPKQLLQATGHFAVGEPQFLVEDRHHGVGFRAQLGGRRSHRIGGLQGMPPLHRSAAMTAGSPMDGKLSVHRPTGNLRLILNDHLRLFQIPAPAMGAASWQRGFVLLVDRLRRCRSRCACRPCSAPDFRPGFFGSGLGPSACGMVPPVAFPHDGLSPATPPVARPSPATSEGLSHVPGRVPRIPQGVPPVPSPAHAVVGSRHAAVPFQRP